MDVIIFAYFTYSYVSIMHKIILEKHFYFENLHQSYELHGSIF